MKKFAWEKFWKMLLEAIFCIRENFFQSFPYKFFVIALHDIIGLENFSLCFC